MIQHCGALRLTISLISATWPETVLIALWPFLASFDPATGRPSNYGQHNHRIT